MRHLETIVWGFGQFIIECIRNLAFIFGGRASSSISSNASVRCGLFCLRLTKKSHFGGWLISSIIPHGSLYIYNVTFFFLLRWQSLKGDVLFGAELAFYSLKPVDFRLAPMSEIQILKLPSSWPLLPWFLTAILCFILSCILGIFGSFPGDFGCKNLIMTNVGR